MGDSIFCDYISQRPRANADNFMALIDKMSCGAGMSGFRGSRTATTGLSSASGSAVETEVDPGFGTSR